MRHLDWYLVACVLLLDVLSVPIVGSATHASYGSYYTTKQTVLVLVSLVVMALATFIDYRDLVDLAPWLYGFTAALLVAVLFIGKNVNGSTRWIPLKVFDLQPSEFAKLTTILFCAWVISRWDTPPSTYWDFIVYYGWLVVPLILILKQPDLGTALVLVAVSSAVLYFGGAPAKRMAMFFIFCLAALVAVFLLHFYAGLPLPMADYQIDRITTFFNPHHDPLQSGYQVLQSKIAIGSGELWGKGLGKGTQNKLEFVPEQHTDFIFSVVGEELGFVKTAFIVCIYAVIMYRCLVAAVTSPDLQGTLVAGGVLALFLFHVLVNMGMTMGIMPVTGVPLPFLSYGGSALLIDSFCIGVVLNVGWRKHKILF